MYDSRDGFGFFYRYHPREIETLCKDKLLGEIKIHSSVIERLNHRTANYAPGYIPAKFEMVDGAEPSNITLYNPGENHQWQATRKQIDAIVLQRKRLYCAMLTVTLFIIASVFYFSGDTMPLEANNGFIDGIATTLYFIFPDFFTGLINVSVVQKPYIFFVAIVLLILYLKYRARLYKKTVRLCETLRHYIIS